MLTIGSGFFLQTALKRLNQLQTVENEMLNKDVLYILRVSAKFMALMRL